MSLCHWCKKMDLGNTTRALKFYDLGKRQDLKNRAEDDECSFFGLEWTKDGFRLGGEKQLVPRWDGNLSTTPAGKCRKISSKVDPSMMHKWYHDLCRHGSSEHDDCQSKSVWRTRNFRDSSLELKVLHLININDKRISDYKSTSGTTVPRYAVLSYALGDTDPPKYDPEQLDDLHQYIFDIDDYPATYRDAMTVAQNLGLNYLWIDAVCLVQGDDRIRGAANMDRIYEGADITIVAADGANAETGLFSIHSSRKSHQHFKHIHIDDYGNDTSTAVWGSVEGLFEHLDRSKYMTRAWCYQELILSSRCLIFTDSMTFFHCRARTFSEDTLWDEHPNIPNSLAIIGTSHQQKKLPVKINDPYGTYCSTLFAYRYRDLGHTDEDIVKAYQGILNRIDHALDGWSVSGMPESFFDMALIWFHRPDLQNRGPPTRTSTWPSWSWAGWKNNAILPFLPVFNADTSNGTNHNKEVNKWLQKHGSRIQFWYTDENGLNMRLVKTSNLGHQNAYLPSPAYPSGVHTHFLQFNTKVAYIPTMTLRSVTCCEIWGKNYNSSHPVGIIYYDGAAIVPSTPYVLAQLCHSPHGDRNFDWERGNPSRDDIAEGLDNRPRIWSKNTDLRWVMMLEWFPVSTTQGYYHRVGMGFIKEDKLQYLDWAATWVAVG